MNLKTLINVLNEGNIALGSKLANLLTEDCVILEYTDSSVLFIKEGKLVSATFKSPAGSMTSDHILDNDIINVSAKALNKELRNKLTTVIEGVLTGNLLEAEENLHTFCETYYQFNTLKSRCPELFAENLVKTNKGFNLRKRAFASVAAFKSALFNAVVVEESVGGDLASLASLVENHGLVLVLGKKKVRGFVTDALLGNSILAESITNYLYTIAEELDNELDDADFSPEYDMEEGQFPDENLEGEDLTSEPEEDAIPEPGDEEGEDSEFEPFDPSMLSEEEVKELHIATLKGILNAIKDFVVEKANDLEDSNIPPDLDEKIGFDLESLDDPEMSDARLSEIEARWQPMIGYFLDSDYHTPDSLSDEFGDESSIDTTVSGGDSEDVSNMDSDLGDGGELGEAGPGDDLGGLPPEEKSPEEV